MKVLTVLFLVAAFALAQGRSAVISKAAFEEAESGDPWLVHLRIANGSGFLNTAVGALVHARWVLTSASGVNDSRFIWIRYGVVNVVNPGLVTETSATRTNGGIALVSINRNVQFSPTIQPIRIESADQALAALPEEGVPFASWGINEDGNHSNLLVRSTFTPVNCINPGENTFCALGEASRTADLGAPLVVGGVVVGVLTQREASSEVTIGTGATFLRAGFYVDWIQQETGLDLSNQAEEVVESDHVAEPETVQVAVLETVQVAALETVQVAELRETVKVASL